MKSFVLAIVLLSLITVPARSQIRTGKSFKSQASGARASHSSTSAGHDRRRDEWNRDRAREAKQRQDREDRRNSKKERQTEQYDFESMRQKLLLESRQKNLASRANEEVTKTVALGQSAKFDPAKAMAPEKMVEQFIEQGRKAESWEQFSNYIPEARMNTIAEEQSAFEAGEAQGEDAPQKLQFEKYKRLATKIIEVGEAKQAGNRAEMLVTVQLEPELSGADRYKVAKLTLRGEGDSWRIQAYQEFGPSYDVPPPPF